MKHRLLLFPAVFLLAFAAIGCVKAASPRGWAAPVENSSTVLVTDAKGKLDAIVTSGDRTGERQWRFPDDWDISDQNAKKTSGIYATPIISGNRAYIADYNGYIYALDLSSAPTRDQDGKVTQKPRPLWSLKPCRAISGGMALDSSSNILFVTNDDGQLYGANVSDASPTFIPYLQTENHIWSAPTVMGRTVYVSSTDGRLYAVSFDGKAPQIAWTFEASAALVTQPVVTGDMVLVGGFDSEIHAVNASNGEEIWSYEGKNWVWARPLVDSGTVYFGDFDGYLYALNLADGKPLWDKPFKASDSLRAAPVMSGDTLVVASHDGHIYGIDPKTGAIRSDTVDVGTNLNADMAKAGASPSLLYIAPSACSSPAQSRDKLYYYGLTVPLNGDKPDKSTGKVC